MYSVRFKCLKSMAFFILTTISPCFKTLSRKAEPILWSLSRTCRKREAIGSRRARMQFVALIPIHSVVNAL